MQTVEQRPIRSRKQLRESVITSYTCRRDGAGTKVQRAFYNAYILSGSTTTER